MLNKIAAMVILSTALAVTATAAPDQPGPAVADPCDRACLNGLVDQYLEAMAQHDPSGLPLAPNVRFTEDTAEIPVGDGLWVGASEAPTTFQIHIPDEETQQAGFFGVMKEFDKPVILALRLKLEYGRITEIEQVLTRNPSAEGMPMLETPRQAWLTPVPPDQRNSRDEMLSIANLYFEAIEQDKGSVAPFADDCVRVENGVQTTTVEPPDPADYGPSEADQARLRRLRIRSLGCAANIDCGNVQYITRIWPRRLVVADPVLGIVLTFPMFVHRADIRAVKITGVPGVDTDPKNIVPFNLQAGELFKVYGGQIHEIEANGRVLPYLSDTGWDNN